MDDDGEISSHDATFRVEQAVVDKMLKGEWHTVSILSLKYFHTLSCLILYRLDSSRFFHILRKKNEHRKVPC